MSELKSIELAIDLATRQREDAGKVMALVQRNCVAAGDQMEQLESYAAQTEARWAISAQVCATPELVRNYYQFIGRLQQAIELQRHAAAKLQQEFMAARKLLLEAEIRIASLNQLLGKKQSVIHRLQSGREQKQLDEFAAMQYRGRQAGSGHEDSGRVDRP